MVIYIINIIIRFNMWRSISCIKFCNNLSNS